jgi:CheY-like chemotaxis protein
MEACAGPSLVHQWVRFEVRDTGIGIPPEKMTMIFESFRQLDSGLARSYSGLGLGLALADKISAVMGGEILVESKVGSGSVFTLRVPLRLPAGSIWAQPEAAPVRLAGRRVLVVDDNKIAQQVISHALKRAGFLFEFADGGEQAVAMAGQSRYDLILMDMEMPDVDGLAATRRIRKIPGYARTPIVAVTANWSDEHRIHCARLGLQEFVSKPIDRAELLHKVESLLPDSTAPADPPQ